MPGKHPYPLLVRDRTGMCVLPPDARSVACETISVLVRFRVSVWDSGERVAARREEWHCRRWGIMGSMLTHRCRIALPVILLLAVTACSSSGPAAGGPATGSPVGPAVQDTAQVVPAHS